MTESDAPSTRPSTSPSPTCENGLILRDSMRVQWDATARLYIQYFWDRGNISPVTEFLGQTVGTGCGLSSQYIDVEEDRLREVRHAIDIVSAFNDGTWDGSTQSISVIADVSGQMIQMIVGYLSGTSSGAIVYTTSTGLLRDTCTTPAHAKLELSLETSGGDTILNVRLCSDNAPGSSA